MGVEDDEIAALQAARKGTALGAKAGGEFDRDLYGGSAKGYSREVVEEAAQPTRSGNGIVHAKPPTNYIISQTLFP